MQGILTAQAAAMPLALAEAGQPQVLRQLESGVALCEGIRIPERPVFLRHCCPAQAAVPLDGTQADLPRAHV